MKAQKIIVPVPHLLFSFNTVFQLPVSESVGALYGILEVDDGPDLVSVWLENGAELGQELV
jgi:hypothetical protein